MSSPHPLSDSWRLVDHDTPLPDSDADDDSYDSEDYIPEPTRQRTTPRRALTTTPRQLRQSPRSVRSYTSNRTTPLRRTPGAAQLPEFIMPTPDHTPIPAKKQSKRMASSQQTPGKQHVRTPKRGLVEEHPPHAWVDPIMATLFYVFKNILDILAIVLSILKYPLAIGVAAIAVRAVIESAMPSFAIPNFLPNLELIPSTCAIPIISNFLPGCDNPSYRNAPKPNAFEEFQNVHHSFEKALDTVYAGRANALQLSYGQVMIKELRDVVKYQSSLPSKPELIHEISQFADQSSSVAEDLIDFNGNIGQAVGAVIVFNRYTLRNLQELKDRSKGVGLAASMLPWIFSVQSRPVTADDIVIQYLKHADDVEVRIDALILEATKLSLNLQGLENRLDMIRETANKDQASFIDKKEVLFESLWTRLGGNARDRKFIEKNIQISKIVSDNSKHAWMQVDFVLKELRRVKIEIKDLRSRISGPRGGTIMSTEEIEEHVLYVQDALDRLDKRRNELQQKEDEDRVQTRAAIDRFHSSLDNPVVKAQKAHSQISGK